MILILCAFNAELNALSRIVTAESSLERYGLKGFRGRVGDADVAVATTGIGIRRARAGARLAFDKLGDADLVIATGVAGALSNRLEVCHMVVADHVMIRRDDNAQPDYVMEIAHDWVTLIEQALAGVGLDFSTGGILTSPRPLGTMIEKRAAGERSGAIAVDMESAAIALEATERGLAFACTRAILDTVNQNVVGVGLADANGHVRPGAAVKALFRNPGMVFGAIGLMHALHRSTHAMARAIDAVVRRIS